MVSVLIGFVGSRVILGGLNGLFVIGASWVSLSFGGDLLIGCDSFVTFSGSFTGSLNFGFIGGASCDRIHGRLAKWRINVSSSSENSNSSSRLRNRSSQLQDSITAMTRGSVSMAGRETRAERVIARITRLPIAGIHRYKTRYGRIGGSF